MNPFARDLIDWYERSYRRLPWRETTDPWKILVSEVMLQQTRVAAVVPFYERFLARFPDARSLADAGEQELLAAWAGLGYYSRARNLQRAARAISEAGSFPRHFEGIRALAGVGDYTAAAVGSIALGLPHAVLDGNVLRVAARLSNDAGDIGVRVVRDRLRAYMQRRLPAESPGTFNQAVMELGATICVPRGPKCLLCPVRDHCEAQKAGTASELPVKPAKPDRIAEEKQLLIVQRVTKKSAVLLWQRPAGSKRLPGFWELPEAQQLPRAEPGRYIGSFRHGIVNSSYTITVRKASLPRAPKGFHWIEKSRLRKLPLSTMARKALYLLEKFASEE